MTEEDIEVRKELDELYAQSRASIVEPLLDYLSCCIEEAYERAETDDGIAGFNVIGVDSEGGQEGGGEYCHVIVEVTRDSESLGFFKVEGSFNSHAGTEWGDWLPVFPLTEAVVSYYNSVEHAKRQEQAAAGLREAVGKLNISFVEQYRGS
jgi:hypothetical protein